MAASTRGYKRTAYRLLTIIGVALLAAAAGIALATVPASGQANVSLGSLDVADVNRTTTGDVTDVRVSATLSYAHDVPDADRRLLKLKVGPSPDQLETIDYVQDADPQGTASGTVDLDGSVLDASTLSAADFQPPLAGTTETTVYIGAAVEVRRAGGDPVTATVVEPVSLTLTDSQELTVEIGGTADVTVRDSG